MWALLSYALSLREHGCASNEAVQRVTLAVLRALTTRLQKCECTARHYPQMWLRAST
jgi:hypothetical protein